MENFCLQCFGNVIKSSGCQLMQKYLPIFIIYTCPDQISLLMENELERARARVKGEKGKAHKIHSK